jgi:hypothetical protein
MSYYDFMGYTHSSKRITFRRNFDVCLLSNDFPLKSP